MRNPSLVRSAIGGRRFAVPPISRSGPPSPDPMLSPILALAHCSPTLPAAPPADFAASTTRRMLAVAGEGTLPTPAEFTELLAAVLAAPTSPAYIATFKALISQWLMWVRPDLSEVEIASFLHVQAVATSAPNLIDDADARQKREYTIGLAAGLPIFATFVALIAMYRIRLRLCKARAVAETVAKLAAASAVAPTVSAGDAPVAV